MADPDHGWLVALTQGGWCVYGGDRWLSEAEAVEAVRGGEGVVGVEGRALCLREQHREPFWVGFLSEVARQEAEDGSWIVAYAVGAVRRVEP